MTSIKQIIANQANALKSSGPSPAGMPNSSANATKHGLFAKCLHVREEDRAAFEQFSEQIYAELRPEGPTEAFYVEHLIDQCWRLRNCLKLETDLFEYYRVYKDVNGDVGVAFAHDASQKNSFTRLSHYAPLFQRGLLKDLAELRKLQARKAQPSTPAQDPIEPASSGAIDDQARNSETTQSATVATRSSSPLSAQPPRVLKTYFAPQGTLTQQVVLSDEDPTQFEAYLDGLFAEWQPRRATRAFFVELFGVTSWRLLRLSRVEAGLFEEYRFHNHIDGGLLTAFVQDATELDCFSKLASCETRLRSGLSRVLKELLT